MISLAYTLVGGVFLIFALFMLALKILRVEPKVLAGLMALLVLGILVPVSIVFWPGADVFAIHLAVYMVTVYALGIVFNQRASHMQSGDGRWFHWGPAAIVSFFLFIIVVDSIFVVLAQKGLHGDVALKFLPEPRGGGGKVSSFFPGTVSHDFRQKESMFNRYLEQRQAQKDRDWQVKLGWYEIPRAGQKAIFQIYVTDNQGQTIKGANVSGRFIRAADSKQDLAFTMKQHKAGFYQTEVNLPVPGKWDLLLNIKQGDALHEVRAGTEVEN